MPTKVLFLTVDNFCVQLENGLDFFSSTFRRFQSKMMNPNILFLVRSLFGTLIFRGKCTTVMIFGNLLSIALHYWLEPTNQFFDFKKGAWVEL